MKKISEITRTECFFTMQLYLATQKYFDDMSIFLKYKLRLPQSSVLTDSGFEVCLFRDFAKENLIKKQNSSFQKQTFDNVFVFSDSLIVLTEAKAQQKFSHKQINKMLEAKKIIEKSNLYEKVLLLGLHSSKYNPMNETVLGFDAIITWDELANNFSNYSVHFKRAEDLYGN